jgi:hypothetical protein
VEQRQEVVLDRKHVVVVGRNEPEIHLGLA